MRKGSVKRTTKETDIDVSVNLDGTGTTQIATGIGFLDHMLDLLARHSRIDMVVKAKGDLHIDHHHTTEDVGIALGQAVKQALSRYYVIPPENLRAVGLGERFLKIPTEEAEAENRRVSVARITPLVGALDE